MIETSNALRYIYTTSTLHFIRHQRNQPSNIAQHEKSGTESKNIDNHILHCVCEKLVEFSPQFPTDIVIQFLVEFYIKHL